MKISLKAARVNAGLSIKDVAKIVDRKPNTVWNWEKGQNPLPAHIFRQLCKIYNAQETDVILPTERQVPNE